MMATQTSRIRPSASAEACASVGQVNRAELIEEAARRLASTARPPARVILFGSHARGDADDESDVDFVVIEPGVDDWMSCQPAFARQVS